jgi:pimeloyl-[acyl-carrier protein] methyl ester esterase
MSTKQKPAAWIMLRGLGREIGHWYGFDELLKKTLAPTPVIALDLPGVGSENGKLPAWNIQGIMEDVRGRIPKSLPQPLGIFAISLGGMVAYEWWRQHPSEVSGLVLVNTSYQSYSNFYRRLRPSAWPIMLSSTLEKNPMERERQILKMVSQRPERYDEWAKAFAKIVEDRPVALPAIARQFKAAWTYRPPRQAPDVPSLLLSSAADAMVHPGCSLALASDWKAPIQYHPSAGHDLTLDEPQWVASAVSQFIKSTYT